MSNWVWRSTEASREEGKISILAIVETLFFVLLTWGVAFYYNFYYYLLVPLVLTPFLMLKTPKSIKKSLNSFLNTKHVLIKLAPITFFVVIVLFTSNIFMLWDKNYLSMFQLVLISIFFVIFIFSYLILFESGPYAFHAFKKNFVFAVFFLIVNFLVGTIFGIYLLLLSLIIKYYVTLCEIILRPIYTLQHIPKNWYEQIVVNDIFYSPELLPRINEFDSSFQVTGLMQDESSDDVFKYILVFFLSLTYLYRWSIKSTAWFYWPLAFVFNKRPLEDKIKGKTHIDDQTNPLTLKGYIVISAILVIYFMGSIVSLDNIGSIESSVKFMDEIFRSIAINHPIVKTIIQPQTWWFVLSATVVYFILYGFSTIQQHRRTHHNPEYSESFNTILHWVIRLKNVLWIAFFAINLFFITNQHVWPIFFNFLRNT